MDMPAEEVARISKALVDANLKHWIEGGWAVEALIPEISLKTHGDADIVVDINEIEQLYSAFRALGYRVFNKKSYPSKVDLVNEKKQKVTLVLFTFNSDGSATRSNAYSYKPEHLTGSGSVCSSPVKCISPEGLLYRYSMHSPRNGRQDELIVNELNKLVAKRGRHYGPSSKSKII